MYFLYRMSGLLYGVLTEKIEFFVFIPSQIKINSKELFDIWADAYYIVSHSNLIGLSDSCTSCTQSPWGCIWCMSKHTCIQSDDSSTCPAMTIIIEQQVGDNLPLNLTRLNSYFCYSFYLLLLCL